MAVMQRRAMHAGFDEGGEARRAMHAGRPHATGLLGVSKMLMRCLRWRSTQVPYDAHGHDGAHACALIQRPPGRPLQGIGLPTSVYTPQSAKTRSEG